MKSPLFAITLGVLGIFLPLSGIAEPTGNETWEFLDNGKIRIGVNRNAGAAIGWFSESGREENILNRFDYGRYVQQSWYGKRDDSDWNGKPWRWNPVQGGNWTGLGARLSEFASEKNLLTASTIPRHWASGEEITDVEFTQKIQLDGDIAIIDFTMRYSGEEIHPIHDQELPAVFVDARYSRLHYLHPEDKGGDPPRVAEPAFPNERLKIREPWIAWLDKDDRGIGVLVPDIELNTVTCYRTAGDPNNRNKGACSYAAPIKRIAVTPAFEFQYRAYLTIGTLAEIRHRFHKIQTGKKP